MINARWARTPNWGDTLNPILIQKLSGEIPKLNTTNPNYLCVGSILQWATDNTIVWGTGIIRKQDILKHKPKVLAVRGPLTRKVLLEQGIPCPEVYGDPALLYPKFYNPKISKKYKYGIIPHLVDKENPWVLKFKNNPDVKIIDIARVSTLNDINSFVDEIKECETILSSSLHGIIAGDAYGIPSYWIELSDKVIGQGFKFRDYFASVKRTDIKPIYIDPDISNTETMIIHIEKQFTDYEINIDLNKLLNACPFLKNK